MALVHDRIILSSDLESKVDAMRQRLAAIPCLRSAKIEIKEPYGDRVRLDYRMSRYSIFCGSDFREINNEIFGHLSMVMQTDSQTGEFVFSFTTYK